MSHFLYQNACKMTMSPYTLFGTSISKRRRMKENSGQQVWVKNAWKNKKTG